MYYVYILTTKNRKLYYIGLTSGLERRLWQHKNKVYKGFTSKYNIYHLIYYEEYRYVFDGISRERQLKKWSRKKKLELVKKVNPELKFLM
ncbi:GIY-YIG nuclease family protein [Candidatus Dojkabacteria bacterium]|uniref:GIY-YIG nuclease family protein n=1 Tax=Candidatus Dojkabacteria bacterium TaxID=2099670 RepID=A0A955RIM2_9BACT|nr:GIY-YIG nuclease family protein [Candidatus Dojkabacteria bacterium]